MLNGPNTFEKPDLPAGYQPGVGRGARPFQTRAEYGGGQKPPAGPSGNQAKPKAADPWGPAPSGYIPGRGRGATGFAGGVSRDESSDASNRGKETNLAESNYDEFMGYSENLFGDTQYDEEDREADDIYEKIDDRMDDRRKSRREKRLRDEIIKARQEKPTLQQQFSDVKRSLATVTQEEWEGIPDIGDFSLTKHKKRKQSNLMPTPDSLMAAARAQGAMAATVQGGATPIGAFGGGATPLGGGLSTPMGLRTPIGLGGGGGMATPMSGMRTPGGAGAGGSLHDVGEAKNTMLSVKLDKLMDSVSGQTVMDPKGYLTDLTSMQLASDADLQDIKKARTLLKSAISTNRSYAPAWIAAVRVEEKAGKLNDARDLLAEACVACPDSEDIWLEAARLSPPDKAKSILANAVRRLPHSVRLWMDAASRELEVDTKKKVFKKALEFIPASVQLWKELINLEEENAARILLTRAVECCPQSVEMWIALARMSPYKEAQKVLNSARKKVPTAPLIWIAAAKLEEQNGTEKGLERILTLSLDSLASHGVTLERDEWIKMAEEAEKSGHVKTCKAIIKVTIRIGVEDHNMKRIWKADADGCLARGSVETARALYTSAISLLKTKKSLWMALAELEHKHGTPESLDNILAKAVTFCPKAEVLWLMAAKHKWNSNDLDGARRVLAEASQKAGTTEGIVLAAGKLEVQTGEFVRARLILQEARRTCDTPQVWMKSVQLERDVAVSDLETAHSLCEEATKKHPQLAKLWMIKGQLSLEQQEKSFEKAAKAFEEGLQPTNCPKSVPLWLCLADVWVQQGNFERARAVLERARIRVPGNEDLWLASVKAEETAVGLKDWMGRWLEEGQSALAQQLSMQSQGLKTAQHRVAKALQECPGSGRIWAEAIFLEPSAAQSAKATAALEKCDNDPHVTLAVACLWWRKENKEKARKWFNSARQLAPSLGDTYVAWLAFEMQHGTEEQQRGVVAKCVREDPHRGDRWNRITKQPECWRMPIAEKLRGCVETLFPSILAKSGPIPMPIEAPHNHASAVKDQTATSEKHNGPPQLQNGQKM